MRVVAHELCGYMQNEITSATDTALYTSFRSITNKEKKNRIAAFDWPKKKDEKLFTGKLTFLELIADITSKPY